MPSPDSLLVNLEESKCLVIDLLNKLPQWFEKNLDTGSALGPALLAAFKMMVSILHSAVCFCVFDAMRYHGKHSFHMGMGFML